VVRIDVFNIFFFRVLEDSSTLNWSVMDDRELLAVWYFGLGLAYEEILAVMAAHHRIVCSVRTLHRILRAHHCYRRQNLTPIDEVVHFVQDLLQRSGSLHGYRWMHARCLQQGFAVSREDIRLILISLDSSGVESRRAKRLRRRDYHSKGPNYLWHFDGYDKLKPYGLCISGCIDGFSRKLIWLKVFKTNNDPQIIGRLLNFVLAYKVLT